MISKEEALQILREESCSSRVIEHSLAVADKSVEIAKKIQENGHEVDINLVEIGALLHDIGRSKTHDVNHGVVGARVLRDRGLEEFASFAENHVGAGIREEESKRLDIPPKNYFPNSLEEKIVAYGDNLLRGSEVITFEEALEEFREELGPDHPTVPRFKELHQELISLINN